MKHISLKLKAIKSTASLGVLSALMLAAPALAIETGEKAPDFSIPGGPGGEMKLSDLKGETVVLEWFNQDCPFVKKHYQNGDMQALQKKWTEKGVKWVVLSSTNKDNDSYRSMEQFKPMAEKMNLAASAVVIDSEGTIGKSFSAKTTPHMFIIDPEGKIAYQGAIDDDSDAHADPKEAKNYVDQALTELAAGKVPSEGTTRAYGCSVKY